MICDNSLFLQSKNNLKKKICLVVYFYICTVPSKKISTNSRVQGELNLTKDIDIRMIDS